MDNDEVIKAEFELFFSGLEALAASAFPKKCSCCGRIFENSEQFLRETERIPTAKSSLKAATEDDGSIIIEVFRNCPCGSTLMDEFSDRREMSEKGEKRRRKFQQMLDFLAGKGLPREASRPELLKLLRGEKSEILAKIAPPKT